MNTGLKQWMLTLLAVAAVLAVASLAGAGTIYTLEGRIVPTLGQRADLGFVGQLEFPGEWSMDGLLRITVEGELEREFEFVWTYDLNDTSYRNYDLRQWTGQDLVMTAVDYEGLAGDVFDSSLMDSQWDTWTVGWQQYQLGTITEMSKLPVVNEPSAMALLALGGVILLGMMRDVQRRR
jgi:hypothetical protein